jgi:hypothetical protein
MPVTPKATLAYCRFGLSIVMLLRVAKLPLQGFLLI